MVKEGTEIELKSVDFELEILEIFNLNLVKRVRFNKSILPGID